MNIQSMMKQAQALQKKMADLQNRFAELEVMGTAGGGMVKVTTNGKGEAKKVAIEASLLVPEDKEVLEDLIVAAFNNAKQNADHVLQEEMAKAGLSPEMMQLPF